ncbi:hypothetical protein SISSUDRAFT_1041089 [Sistotremastrum suecicum HHB10207 ss-3]|uniref:Uncharacterized protein n=1 Tax=Sistotremastrum suecicum HHB10207 ss-3 TaxID=1314776 RepID=A0A166HL55_9AGAM|nr:hypothetical protein SISSUDRAFT_1041089 [Sistotremastrum suecicum HHB10207 ss-3]
MWCTRWILPFLLLPAPTSPPYFVLFFIISLVLHARPCVYCIGFLITLFVTSSYWSPVPTTELLSSLYNTTDIANATGFPLKLSDVPLPALVTLIDRCWLDFYSPSFFGPFNVTKWEEHSLLAALEPLAVSAEEAQNREGYVTLGNQQQGTTTADSPASVEVDEEQGQESTGRSLRRRMAKEVNSWLAYFQKAEAVNPSSSPAEAEEHVSGPTATAEGQTDHNDGDKRSSSASSHKSQPWLRRKYDLRPYGVGATIDFGWSRT